VGNKAKPLVGKTSQKRKILLLGSGYGQEIGPMLHPYTLVLNMKSQVLLRPMDLLLMGLRAWGSMVMTLPSEIMLL
jgi:hypothetical protein